ncbi:MAG: glycosyltransferase family 4 protein [Thermoplasmatales archaeon]
MQHKEELNGSGKRILFILDSRWSHWKGTQRFLYEFGNYLQDLNYDVTLIENLSAVLPDTPVQSGVFPKFKIIGYRFRKLFSIFIIPKNVLEELNPDLIYVANLNSMPFIRLRNVPVIYGSHLLNISSLPFVPLKTRIVFRAKKIVLKFISKSFWRGRPIFFHAINSDQTDWFNKNFREIPVFEIGLPIDCSVREKIDNLHAFKKNIRFTILYFGAFSELRGFREFLDIVELIEHDELKDSVEFVLSGGGPLFKLAVPYKEKYKNFKIIERPSDEEKIDIMINSDLFIYPSVIENFSITTVEAQLCGLPSLVADTQPLRNIVLEGKTGHLINPKSDLKEYLKYTHKYFELWNTDFESYKKLRLSISKSTTRLCKDQVLPELREMVEKSLKYSSDHRPS